MINIKPIKNFALTNPSLPPDKSIFIRAVLFNAIAKGRARIGFFGEMGEDILSAIDVARKMGASICFCEGKNSNRVEGESSNRAEGENNNSASMRSLTIEGATRILGGEFDCKNSATLMRLLIGIMAGANCRATIYGDQSLNARPMGRVVEPLRKMGALISTNGFAPVVVEPSKLNHIEYTMSVASAQVKSALLLAGLSAHGICINEPIKTRDHSEILLGKMGANLSIQDKRVELTNSTLKAQSIIIPADISSAAFLFGLALVSGGRVSVKNVGLNPLRTGFLDVLRRAGARVEISNEIESGGERVGDVCVLGSMGSFSICGDDVVRCIDELPLLATLACFARGKSIISHASELRVKECDRIKAMCEGLSALGARIEEREDGMIIFGQGGLEGSALPLKSYGDHRIAMALAVAAAGSKRGAPIEGECAAVSFPTFFSYL